MTNATIDYDLIGNAAAEAEDQTKMKEGGKRFEKVLPVAGACILRLQQYIEVGVQKARKATYKDQEEVMLRFELLTPKHMIEIDTEEGKKKVPNYIDISLPKGGSTSKYGRLFAALNVSGKFNHFAQMVGKAAWRAEITHNKVGTGDEEKTYANLDKNKAWTFAAPVNEDPVSGSITAIPVPELHGEPKVFLYENKGLTDAQYLTLWDTLFIEGETEAKGDKPAKSKNWIQEKILNSVKFSGTRLEKLLAARTETGGADIDELIENAEQAEVPEEAKAEKPIESTEIEPEADSNADIDPLLELL